MCVCVCARARVCACVCVCLFVYMVVIDVRSKVYACIAKDIPVWLLFFSKQRIYISFSAVAIVLAVMKTKEQSFCRLF